MTGSLIGKASALSFLDLIDISFISSRVRRLTHLPIKNTKIHKNKKCDDSGVSNNSKRKNNKAVIV